MIFSLYINSPSWDSIISLRDPLRLRATRSGDTVYDTLGLSSPCFRQNSGSDLQGIGIHEKSLR